MSPADLGAALTAAPPGSTVIIDCLALWLTRLIDAVAGWDEAAGLGTGSAAATTVTDGCEALLAGLATTAAGHVIMVTNEVGSGVVPATASGRFFRDQLGRVNARVAGLCSEVYLVVAAVPCHSRPLPGVPWLTESTSTPCEQRSPRQTSRAGRRQSPPGRPHQARRLPRRLEDPVDLVGGSPGHLSPSVPHSPRLVIFAGDHGIVGAAGTSAYPPEVTAQMVLNFLAGGAAANVLARAVGVQVRVLDIAVDTDWAGSSVPAGLTRHKVRRSSGPIDRADALSRADAERAFNSGRTIADEEVDSGADLLIAGDMGIGNTTAASALVAALTGRGPVEVVGRGTGIDDDTWMRKCAAVRDALYRSRGVGADPIDLLASLGGADLAAMAGFLTQAAVRGVPVILDGAVVGAAALVAATAAPQPRTGGLPGTSRWSLPTASPWSACNWSRSSTTGCGWAKGREPSWPSASSTRPRRRWRRWPRSRTPACQGQPMTAEHLTSAAQPASTRLDGALLGAGTFTAIRVPPPRRVDAAAGEVAMLTAPIWGLIVGLCAGAAGCAVTLVAGWTGNASPLTALLAGVAAVAGGAWITRGLHLDGLADVADALASARRGPQGWRSCAIRASGRSAPSPSAWRFWRRRWPSGRFSPAGGPGGRRGGGRHGSGAAGAARAPRDTSRRQRPGPHRGWFHSPSVGHALGRPCDHGRGRLVGERGRHRIVGSGGAAAAWLCALGVRRAALRRFDALTGDALGAAIEFGCTAALLVLAVAG